MERVEVTDALTLDKMILSKFELLVFHRVDQGDQSEGSGQYKYDRNVILNSIWSPTGGDWRDTVKSIGSSTARDIIAQYTFDQIVTISGAERRVLIDQLTNQINAITKNALGVEITGTNIGAITISDSAKETLAKRILAEVERKIQVTAAEAEGEAFAIKGAGQAQAFARVEAIKSRVRDQVIVQVHNLLSQGNPPPIADPMVAARFLQLVEELTKAVIRDDVRAVRYAEALEEFAKSAGEKTIYLGTEGLPSLPDGNRTEKP
jgi:regulator of protease activity HflC (stomatin/prohibitin superfamily)